MVVSQQLTDTYRALQREAEGYVLLMQVGAFMQVMDEGARQVSAEAPARRRGLARA